MNILATPVKIHKILSPVPQFLINHGVQRGRFRTYTQTYPRKIRNLSVESPLIHRLFKSGIVILCPVHSESVFRKEHKFPTKKQAREGNKRG